MGFWDSIMGNDKSSEAPSDDKSGNPFSVSVNFSPLRLSANNRSSVNLLVKVKNVSKSPQLVSVDALRGFDMFWIIGGGTVIGSR